MEEIPPRAPLAGVFPHKLWLKSYKQFYENTHLGRKLPRKARMTPFQTGAGLSSERSASSVLRAGLQQRLPALLRPKKTENGSEVQLESLKSTNRTASSQEKLHFASGLVRVGGGGGAPGSRWGHPSSLQPKPEDCWFPVEVLATQTSRSPSEGAGAQGFCGPGDRTTGVDRPSTLRAGMWIWLLPLAGN